MKPYNKYLKQPSRELRKNMTDAERLLWSRVRRKQIKGVPFYRQKPLANYIVDFYCPAANLVVEVDGGQHFTAEGQAKDRHQDEYLTSLGLKVLRFSDTEVLKETDAVLQVIWENVEIRGILEAKQTQRSTNYTASPGKKSKSSVRKFP